MYKTVQNVIKNNINTKIEIKCANGFETTKYSILQHKKERKATLPPK